MRRTFLARQPVLWECHCQAAQALAQHVLGDRLCACSTRETAVNIGIDTRDDPPVLDTAEHDVQKTTRNYDLSACWPRTTDLS